MYVQVSLMKGLLRKEHGGCALICSICIKKFNHMLIYDVAINILQTDIK